MNKTLPKHLWYQHDHLGSAMYWANQLIPKEKAFIVYTSEYCFEIKQESEIESFALIRHLASREENIWNIYKAVSESAMKRFFKIRGNVEGRYSKGGSDLSPFYIKKSDSDFPYIIDYLALQNIKLDHNFSEAIVTQCDGDYQYVFLKDSFNYFRFK